MPHGPEQHIEHAEHAQHAAHDPFDRRVTLSIAIVAAILACVTMLGHRAHNQTLLYQGKAIEFLNEASNKWNYYQSNKIRMHLYQGNMELLTEIAKLGTGKVSADTRQKWEELINKYKDRLPKEQATAEDFAKKAKEKLEESEQAHLRANRLDGGELGIELAVVLCSLSLLTKRRGYWYIGLLSCALGTFWALTGILGLFLGNGHGH